MKAALIVWAISAPLIANDVVYLHGKVQLADGSKPGKSAVIQLDCKGAEPVRVSNSGKNGSYYMRVERDDFNHVARSLPATTTDVGGGSAVSGSCVLRAVLAGYESSSVDFSNFTIGKDLQVPAITLKQK
ncbi:MAG TPA: hypothetical protein VGS58_08930 [Candidatus Sulfopaludibacter sp.]|nr:hypothetical protein [Candidatus Sulfopaludibacter sp.]